MSNKRWKLTIEYDGAPFCGWQRQDDAPSVQEEIEKALFKFCGRHLRLHAAGRTDAGVHAWGQVAHFDLDYGDRPLSGYDLAKAINALIRPAPIAILDVQEVSEDFHARFGATNKLYRYRVINRSATLSLDLHRAWHIFKELDAGKMHEAAQTLLGQHDFTTFRATECQGKSPIRTIDRFDVIRTGDEIKFEVEGRSFLHHQVRNMVGSLKMVGEGKWSLDDFIVARDAKDRAKGGMTAPPDGLYLVRVDYQLS